MGFTSILAFTSLYLLDLGISNSVVGIARAFGSLGYALPVYLIGHLADRIGTVLSGIGSAILIAATSDRTHTGAGK